jgi:thiol-disulfide isomerase/thioredoxin
MSRQWAVTGIVLAGLALGAAGLTWVAPDGTVEIDREAPNFQVVDLATGDSVSLDDYRGSVTLVNIWATWCVPCREEMPQLNALQAELGGPKFEVVAINIDKGGAEKAKTFLEETGAKDLAFYADPTGKLFARLKAVGMPTTLLLNSQGEEMGRLVGPADWASPEAKALIEAAIASAGAS